VGRQSDGSGVGGLARLSGLSRSARRSVVFAVLVVAGVLVAAVVSSAVSGSGSAGSHRASASLGGSVAGGGPAGMGSGAAPGSASAPAAAPAAGSASGSAAGSASGSAPVSGSAPGSAPPEAVPALPPRVIKTGSVMLLVPAGRLQSVIDGISARAGLYGGFVSASSIGPPVLPAAGGALTPTLPIGGTPTGSVTLRVPAHSFEALVAYAEGAGTVTSASTSGQDVTASYVDLQARISALQDTRSQFEQLLTRATAIGDILSVESQISDLQTQIEQLQGQLQVMDDQTTYSTLTVDVTERPAPGAPVRTSHPSGLTRAWDHARHSFTHGVEAVLSATGGIAVFLLFVGLAALAGRLAWRAGRRYRSRRAA
jgi:hypothetical protein